MSVTSDWPWGPAAPRALPGTVDVWNIDLEQCRPAMDELTSFLSAEELARVARFRFERDGRWFALRRGLLRMLLARYVGASPAALRFAVNAYGKPELDAHSHVTFSMSHSCGRVLLAVTALHPVGVDLERIRPQFAAESVPERFFAADEVTELRQLASAEQVTGFFNAWTRKEAYVKARGLGLSLPLDSFSVALAPGMPALLRRRPPDDTQVWSLVALEPAPEYAGALAARGSDVRVCCWSWAPGTT